LEEANFAQRKTRKKTAGCKIRPEVGGKADISGPDDILSPDLACAQSVFGNFKATSELPAMVARGKKAFGMPAIAMTESW